MAELEPSMNTTLSLRTSFRNLTSLLDNEFVALYIVCWMAIGVIAFLWNRHSYIRSFTCPLSFSQTARLLFQRTFKVQESSLAWCKGRAPASRKCRYLVCFLLFLFLFLLSAFELQETIRRKSKNWLDKERDKLGFYRVQTAMDELIAMDGVTLQQILDPTKSMIVEWFPVLSCEEDKSLLQRQLAQERVFVAANLINCAELMPNFVLQLLKFISLFDEDQVRVSIYESGSTDLTPSWLNLLQKILIASSITSTIIVKGGLIRDPKEDRIEFLAKIKNAAIAPMLEWNRGPSPWIAQKVVFTNDVYFCPQHILRLLLHEDEDVVCGMDFSLWISSLPRSVQKPLMIRDLTQRFYLPSSFVSFLSNVKRFLRIWRRSLSHDDFLRLEIPLAFYDRWTTIDLDGMNFVHTPPYILESESRERLSHGCSVYVHSCWNGMAILNAKPLYQNLKFRSCYQEECQSSECFFLCHDYVQLGYDRIMIDPGVRFAYHYEEAIALYNSSRVQGLVFVPWDADGIRDHDIQQKRHPTSVTCCVLGNGDFTRFDKDCRFFDYSNLNCTLRAMGVSDSCSRYPFH